MEFLDLEIRLRLGRYVRGEDTLDEFRAWFTPATWDVHLSRNTLAINLSNRVSFLLGEYVTRHINESQLRKRLSPLIETYVAVYGSLDVELTTQLSGVRRSEPYVGAGT